MKSIKRKYVTDNELKNNKFIIFGEMHTTEDRDEVESLIRRAHTLKPFKVLFSEECGSEVFLTPNAIKRGLALEKWSISDRSFKLALELGLQVVGCDLWDKTVYAWDKKDENGVYTDCRRSFALREQFMIDQVMGLCNPHNPHVRGCMIVGDSHLRMTKNPVMGDASALVNLCLEIGMKKPLVPEGSTYPLIVHLGGVSQADELLKESFLIKINRIFDSVNYNNSVKTIYSYNHWLAFRNF